VHGGQGEFGAGPAEPREVRRPGKLPLWIRFDRGKHDLADQAGGLDPDSVVKKRKTFAVPGRALGHIGGDDPPSGAEPVKQEPQRFGAAADFLQCDDVEAGDQLGNARHGMPVAFVSHVRLGSASRGDSP
jgi:hypothetical protein